MHESGPAAHQQTYRDAVPAARSLRRDAGSGAAPEESPYQWTPSVRLQPLLDSVEANVRVGLQRGQGEQPRIARHLSCQANQSGLLQASFCIGVTPSQDRTGLL